MNPHKPPKVCIVRAPITLCQLAFVQAVEEVSIPVDQLAMELFEVIRDYRTYEQKLRKFEIRLLERLQLSALPEDPGVVLLELNWLLKNLLFELEQVGLSPAKEALPFNSMTMDGGDAFVLMRVDKNDVDGIGP